MLAAGGDGLIGAAASEIFVLYLDPGRRNEGIDTKILDALTSQQKEFGADKQWASAGKGNQKGVILE